MNLFSETAGLAVGIVQIKYTVAVFFCGLVKLFCRIFELFAGLTPLYYKGGETKLLPALFAGKGMLMVYWCMAALGIASALVLAISETLKRRRILSEKKQAGSRLFVKDLWQSFAGCSICMIALTICVSIVLHYASLLLGQFGSRIWGDYTKPPRQEREFTEEELAVMAKTLAVVGNYAATEPYNSVYNLNACYNEIRPALQWLDERGVFSYRYPARDAAGKDSESWQSALSKIVLAADLSKNAELSDHQEALDQAVLGVMEEIRGNEAFHALPSFTEDAFISYEENGSGILDALCFLSGTLRGAINPEYNRAPEMTDVLRGRFYKDREGNLSIYRAVDVASCFRPEKLEYGLICFTAFCMGSVMFLIVAECFFKVVSLLILYLSAPSFFASWPKDHGLRARRWLTAFLIRCVSLLSLIFAVRCAHLLIPVVMNQPLSSEESNLQVVWLVKLLAILVFLVLAWALGRIVEKALSGSAGMIAIRSESAVFEAVLSMEEQFPHLLRRRALRRRQEKTGSDAEPEKSAAPSGLKKEAAAQKKAFTSVTDEDAVSESPQKSIPDTDRMKDKDLATQVSRRPELSEGQILIRNKVRKKVPKG